MTLEDFKDVYKDKTPVEMLDLLAEQHATWRHDAVAREKSRDSIDGGAYYANECRAMEARVEWLMGRLKDALKPMEPMPDEAFPLLGVYKCGNCNTPLGLPRSAKYCMNCGKPAKWE